MKDLWGIRLSRGKSQCRLEEAEEEVKEEAPYARRWITDVWPKAAWLNCKTKKTHLLFHSPVFYFSFFLQTRFHPSLPSVSEHYYYFPLWFTFLASVFTLSVPWRTPWSLLSTDGKYHFCHHKKGGWEWEASQNHCSQQRPLVFLFLFCFICHQKCNMKQKGLEKGLEGDNKWRLQNSSKCHELGHSLCLQTVMFWKYTQEAPNLTKVSSSLHSYSFYYPDSSLLSFFTKRSQKWDQIQVLRSNCTNPSMTSFFF